MIHKIENISLYGIKVSIFEKDQLIRYFEETLSAKKQIICYGLSLGMFSKFKKEPEIYLYSDKFDIMVTDGKPFYWFGKFLGFPLKSFLSIPEMTLLTLDIANKYNYKVLMVGGTPENNKKAIINLRNKYGNMQVLDGIDGFFKQEDEENIISRIQQLNPDILLIGMPSPKKEIFAYTCKNKTSCSIIVPCGGMIDILAGNYKLTPKWLKKLGLALIFRYIQQPISRFRVTSYALINFSILFPVLMAVKIFRIKKFSIPSYFGIKKTEPDIEIPLK